MLTSHGSSLVAYKIAVQPRQDADAAAAQPRCVSHAYATALTSHGTTRLPSFLLQIEPIYRKAAEREALRRTNG